MTLDWWNSFFQITSAVLLGLTFIAGAGAIITGHFIGKRQAALIAEANRQAAEAGQGAARALADAAAANERANKLELDTGQQRERAAKAEKEVLELQQKLAWRELTPTQAQRFVSELRRFTGTRVVLIKLLNDPEAGRFATQLEDILSAAQWSLSIVSVGTIGPSIFGVRCEHKADDPAAKAFIQLLKSANVAVSDRIGLDPWPPGETPVPFRVLVGVKPRSEPGR